MQQQKSLLQIALPFKTKAPTEEENQRHKKFSNLRTAPSTGLKHRPGTLDMTSFGFWALYWRQAGRTCVMSAIRVVNVP